MGYKKFSCNTRFTLQLRKYIYIYFFLVVGYCAGQWYFHTSACVSVRYVVKYTSVADKKAITSFIVLDYFSRRASSARGESRHCQQQRIDAITTRALAVIG